MYGGRFRSVEARLFADLFQRCSQHLSLTCLLHEGNYPKIGQIGSGIEFDANVLRKNLPGFEASDFCQALHHTHMSQAAATVFAAQYLRLSVIQRNHKINISAADLGSFWQEIGFDM